MMEQGIAFYLKDGTEIVDTSEVQSFKIDDLGKEIIRSKWVVSNNHLIRTELIDRISLEGVRNVGTGTEYQPVGG